MFLDGGVLPANIAASSARGKAILIYTFKEKSKNSIKWIEYEYFGTKQILISINRRQMNTFELS